MEKEEKSKVPNVFKGINDEKSFKVNLKKILTRYYEEEMAKNYVELILNTYLGIEKELPYIGGDDNPYRIALKGGAQGLALYKVMKNVGLPLEKIGTIFNEWMKDFYFTLPDTYRQEVNRLRFGEEYILKMKHLAKESQKRRYSEDWVYTLVDGKGEDFDYGIDYTECGICKMFKSAGLEEFIPFICECDFILGEAFGLGLTRTMTLAEGKEKCDFRFKKNGKTGRKK